MTARVDVLVVLHNSRKWIPGLLAGLRNITVPVTVLFLDNGSSDGTADSIAAEHAS